MVFTGIAHSPQSRRDVPRARAFSRVRRLGQVTRTGTAVKVDSLDAVLLGEKEGKFDFPGEAEDRIIGYPLEPLFK